VYTCLIIWKTITNGFSLLENAAHFCRSWIDYCWFQQSFMLNNTFVNFVGSINIDCLYNIDLLKSCLLINIDCLKLLISIDMKCTMSKLWRKSSHFKYFFRKFGNFLDISRNKLKSFEFLKNLSNFFEIFLKSFWKSFQNILKYFVNLVESIRIF